MLSSSEMRRIDLCSITMLDSQSITLQTPLALCNPPCTMSLHIKDHIFSLIPVLGFTFRPTECEISSFLKMEMEST